MQRRPSVGEPTKKSQSGWFLEFYSDIIQETPDEWGPCHLWQRPSASVVIRHRCQLTTSGMCCHPTALLGYDEDKKLTEGYLSSGSVTWLLFQPKSPEKMAIFAPPFQHLLSERLTSLGIMGAPRVPPLNPWETIVLSSLTEGSLSSGSVTWLLFQPNSREKIPGAALPSSPFFSPLESSSLPFASWWVHL